MKTLNGTNQTDIRAYNKKLILTLIRNKGAAAITEIASLTGLTSQTVSVIVRDLKKEGLLISEEPVRGKVGKPMMPMSLNPVGAYFLGATIGRQNTVFTKVNFMGEICFIKKLSYAFPEPEKIIHFIRDMFAMMAKKKPATWKKVYGAGIAMPYQMWDWAKQLGASSKVLDMWRQTDLLEAVSEFSDIPIYLENDATSACYAELNLNNSTLYQDALYFYIDYFIGGGIILNQSVYAGNLGNAGALGSMLVPNGNGKTTQLLSIASLFCLEKRLKTAGKFPEAFWDNPGSWPAKSPEVGQWIEEAAAAISCAIVSANAVIDFSHTVIDGWLTEEIRERLLKTIRQKIGELSLLGLHPIKIVSGSVGFQARNLGGALLPLFRDFMLSPHLAIQKNGTDNKF